MPTIVAGEAMGHIVTQAPAGRLPATGADLLEGVGRPAPAVSGPVSLTSRTDSRTADGQVCSGQLLPDTTSLRDSYGMKVRLHCRVCMWDCWHDTGFFPLR